MTKDNQPRGGKPGDPPEGHNPEAEQLAAINENLKSFREKYEKDNFKQDRHTRRQFWLEIAVATGVGIYTIITALILCVQRDTEQRQLRAYLVVVINEKYNLEVFSHKLTGGTFGVLNTGQTPATHVRQVAHTAVFPYPLIKSPLSECPIDMSDAKSSLSVGSQQTFINHSTFGCGESVADDQISALERDQTKRIYQFGIIKYLDIFNSERETIFCFSMHELRAGAVEAQYCPIDNEIK